MKDLTDKEKEALDKIKIELTRAYANLDINAINAIFAPHGRNVFNSHEEFMATATERAIQQMTEHFSRQKAFEEEE